MPYSDRAKQREAQADYARRARRAKTTYRDKIREFIRSLKESRPCHDCKVPYPYYVMQFDHARGEKLFELSKATNGRVAGVAAILAEAEKCDVVCANCHAERTHRRGLAERSGTGL